MRIPLLVANARIIPTQTKTIPAITFLLNQILSQPNMKITVNTIPLAAPPAVIRITKNIKLIGIVIIVEKGRDFSLPSLS